MLPTAPAGKPSETFRKLNPWQGSGQLLISYPCPNPERDRWSGLPPPSPRKITSYIGFYRNRDLHPHPPPPPKKKEIIIKSCTPPPPPPTINVSTLLNRKKYSCKKNNNKKHPVFSVIWVWTPPAPVSICEERVEGGGYYNIFIHTWARTILGFKILNFNTFEGFQKNV